MTASQTHTLVHRRVVEAPVQRVYALVEDVTRWPVIFEPCVHVQQLRRENGSETFRLWALVNDAVHSWTSRRELDPSGPDGPRIRFAQERSNPPVTAMSGEWLFRPLPGGRTEIVLTHHFAVLDRPGAAESTATAVDRNSLSELAALSAVAEQAHPLSDLVFSFTDTMPVAVPPAEAYDFLARADRWPDLLPHVRRTRLRVPGDTPRPDPEPGRELPPAGQGIEQDGGTVVPELEMTVQDVEMTVQDLEMDTLTDDGGTHTTRSIRLCRAPDTIVYKQLVRPAALLGHAGAWTLTHGPTGTTATALHTVALDAARIVELLGPGATPAQAREHLRRVLGSNSRRTLAAASRSSGAPCVPGPGTQDGPVAPVDRP